MMCFYYWVYLGMIYLTIFLVLTLLRSLQASGTSVILSFLSPSVFVASGSRYSFRCRCIVILRLKWLNLTSISFLGFNDLCQYLQNMRNYNSSFLIHITLKLQQQNNSANIHKLIVNTEIFAYLHVPTGLGSTTPAVYTAWNIPWQFTRLVISRISTGASRFERSFLWTHRKFISTSLTT